MSLAPPPPAPFRRDAVLFAAGQFRTSARCAAPARSFIAGAGSRKKKVEVRRAPLDCPLFGCKRIDFAKQDVETERRWQRGRHGRRPAAGRGGGWSGGGGGGWFRWFSSGGFWDAAKQTLLTIFSIIAAFFLIANFNALVAAVVNSLLAVLRQIRRAISFVAHCVSQGMSVSASRPKSTPVDSSNLAAVPVNDTTRMSAKERVIRKWGLN